MKKILIATLGCALAVVSVGGGAQGIGLLFGALGWVWRGTPR